YERDLASQSLSYELLYAIRGVVQDCQSALDATATKVKAKYGKGTWKPYFPLVAPSEGPNEFQTKLEEQIKGLAGSHPNIASAFERHQPYHPGHTELGYLKKLSNANKHADFTAQTRSEQRQWHQGGVLWSEGVSWSGGVSVNVGGTMRPMGDPATTSVKVFVHWQFVDPPVPVLPTLEALVSQTEAAVTDIHHEAAL
ncbi:MAG: hypothetical protein LC808_38275, partial [Actinobacteria bacterium]|nr:hypothetical protein [Actinomycetota bacterium]